MEHMSDYVFFEYTAVVHLTGKSQSAPIHCLAKMKTKDSEGDAISNEHLKGRAEDLIFMDLKPEERHLSKSEIWQVDEERVEQLGIATQSESHSEGATYRYEN
jgi:hypothetical protein